MTPSQEKRDERLWQRLVAAHREQPEIEPGPGWQAGVLQVVHRLPAASPARFEPGAVFVAQLVWRAALAGGVAAVVAASYLLAQPSGTDLVTSLLLDDQSEGVIELALNQ